LPIYKATPVSAAVVAAADEASQSSHVGLIEQDQSILDIMLVVGGGRVVVNTKLRGKPILRKPPGRSILTLLGGWIKRYAIIFRVV
jgi:hypothetical protein